MLEDVADKRTSGLSLLVEYFCSSQASPRSKVDKWLHQLSHDCLSL